MSSTSVVLDANVLIPGSLRDTLLRLFAAGLYKGYWQAEILDEVRRNLVKIGTYQQEGADKLIEAMQRQFTDAMVADDYKALEPNLTNSPKDRHVLAAAITSNSPIIITFNLKDFPPTVLTAYNIQAQLPDTFLIQCFKTDPERVVQVIQEQAANLKRPPLSVSQFLHTLTKHAPNFIDLVRQEMGLS